MRQVHNILEGAFARAVRWRWIGVNPADQAKAPTQPAPDPQPPSQTQAARIAMEAWKDPDWGMFVWLAMTSGARRGELCALRWDRLDFANVCCRSVPDPYQHRPERQPNLGQGHQDSPETTHSPRRSDSRALAARMPELPAVLADVDTPALPGAPVREEDASPYQRIAADLRAAIHCGALQSGGFLPTLKDLATRYDVSAGTAHRAITELTTAGEAKVTRGKRAIVTLA